MNKNLAKCFLTFSILCFLLVFFFTNDILDSLSGAVSISFFFLVCYDLFLWRVNPFEKMPKLKKKYISNQKSSYNDGTQFSSEVIIKQTLSTIRIIEIWNKNRCYSVNATLSRDEHGNWKLYYTYLTHPDPFHSVENSDEMHFGTCILNIDSNKKISGEYFTNRKPQPTYGTIEWLTK